MNKQQTHRFGMLAMAVLALGLLGGSLLAGRSTSRDLGGAERYLTHVGTDKPIYRPGETLHVRGVVLHAHNRAPLPDTGQIHGQVEIKGPKGDVVAGGWAGSQDSVIAFDWPIPAGQAGGQYVVRITYPGVGHAPAERSFDIRAYRAPRLKSQIVFFRDGYGPGDEVVATLHVERAEGGVPAGAKVTVIARVDGDEVYTGSARVDAEGNCTVRFTLPAEITRGEGTLALVIEDGGVVETAAKTIPILLQTLDLTLYPEGGELIAGLRTRVYIEAKTPAQQPADIAGVVVDADGRTVVTVRTEHEGRGRFAFTPVKGGQYTLRITEPAGIRTTYPLGTVRDEGAVIRPVENQSRKGEPVRLRVGSTSAEPLTVTLSQREVEVASARVDPRPGELTEVSLTPPSTAGGVLIATVWDSEGKPLAERLIYRQPANTFSIRIEPDRSSYVPGGTVGLTVTTTDERGRPIAAVIGLTVTDDSVLEMIEKREQAPRLPVMVLLEDDVRELADAHVYLDASNPDAPLAVDLLLGTQGWRRFAFIDSEKFLAGGGDAARRVLAFRMVRQPRVMSQFGFARGGVADAWPEILQRKAPVAVAAARPADADGDERVDLFDEVAGEPEAELRLEADKRGRVNAKAIPALRQQLAKAIAEAEVAREANLFIAADLIAGQRLSRRRNDMLAVRVYAHAVRAGRQPGQRVDFTETLYWHAGIRTDAKTGQATVSFALNDAVTAFRVFADGFTETGGLAEATTTIESVKPFYLEPKLPLEVTAGDRIDLPLAIVNGLDHALSGVQVTAEVPNGIRISSLDALTLAPGSRVRQLLEMRIGHFTGTANIILAAKGGAYSDRVTRTLNVQPLGFPVEVAFGGVIGPDASVIKTITIPADVVTGSVATNVAIYPTPLANLTEALTRLIREPSGCFEQASSTIYPLIMAQQYFQSHSGIDPALIARSRGLLEKGYARLVSFECKEKGYEWFGADPGHEALSAYGLLEFTDLAKVQTVDAAMLARTRAWLLGSRDGKGGFTRKRRALHTWIADPDCSNAYITWALLESGEKNIAAEVAALKPAAMKSKNSYVVALAAKVMALAGETATARQLMDRLVALQTDDGSVGGATTSIVGSGGQALSIETTAMAVLAWLPDPSYTAAVERGIRYLADSCKAGRYGSTQSTVLALRAIVAYDQARARPKAPGHARIHVDGQPVGNAVAFDATTQGAIKLPEISELLDAGEHTIELKMDGGSSMPFSLAVTYHNTSPASSSECVVDLKVELRDTVMNEGAVTEAAVVITNASPEAIPTPIAIVGLPGGLEPRHDQLKELVKAGRIAAYEVIGREVVLYWREMKANQVITFPISLVAAVPGTYTGPASRAYLYYTDEFKTWVPGVKVAIKPRG